MSRTRRTGQYQQDQHIAVFLDPAGGRWKKVAVTCAGLLAITLVALTAITAAIAQPLNISGFQILTRVSLDRHKTGKAPIIGQGPLERVAKVIKESEQTHRLIDPFTGDRLGVVSQADLGLIKDASYVVQRYGYTPGAKKMLCLTFDDGPNPIITPKLLDLLSKEHVPATFFITGQAAVQAPAIVKRIVAEGHAVAGHSVTHPHLVDKPTWRTDLEVTTTDRLIRSITGHRSTMVRLPYTSPEGNAPSDEIDGILRLQRLGYQHASYDFDTLDWEHEADPSQGVDHIALPDLSNGANHTILMHDSGGPRRELTISYVAKLISAAKEHGYTFATMPQASPALADANSLVISSWVNTLAVWAVKLLVISPGPVMAGLFWAAVALMVIYGVSNALLALIRYWNRRRRRWDNIPDVFLPTAVVLAAYNEAPVIERTIRSIMASTYPISEVIVVDDGSSDETASIVAGLQQEFASLVLIKQPNGGKAAALNHGIGFSQAEVVVTLDADTIMATRSIEFLVRHFAADHRRRLGAVAGVVRVGNLRKNWLTRWQGLEYLTQIGLDRAAQDTIGGISIIPGACAAWRKEAIEAAGGYSTDTLAEDCDLALNLHTLGWRVSQDDEAIAYTEAPETLEALLKQRSRWTYGTMQAIYKNRSLIFSLKHPGLGWYTLPNYLLSIVIPLIFLPFTMWMSLMTLQHDGPLILIKFFVGFALCHGLLAALAVRLMRESWQHLWVIAFYRLFYEPLRAYLLFTSIMCVLRGNGMGWNKLSRTGSLDQILPAATVTAVTEVAA